MAISKQRRVLPLGSLLQNEPHLRRHTLTLARNAHFNWCEALAINGGIGLIDGEPMSAVDGTWPDGARILARTERPDFGGTTSPWVIQGQTRNCSMWIEFPALSIGPLEVVSFSALWNYGVIELALPVGVWHHAILTFEDIEPGALFAWATWGERPLEADEIVAADGALLMESSGSILMESSGSILLESGTDTKISGLVSASALTGFEQTPIIQLGSTVALSTADLAAWIAGQI